MAAKPLPTGQEPPKGYERLLDDMRADHDALRIDRVAATQLSSPEKREIDRIRNKALSLLRAVSVRMDFDFSFEDEIALWPSEKQPSDKLIYRGYYEGALRGYALVVTGWPEPDAWTVQHIVIDPEYRNRGGGMYLVQAVEKDILETTEGIDELVAFPIALTDNGFWDNIGFEKGEGMSAVWGGQEYPLLVYRKSIR